MWIKSCHEIINRFPWRDDDDGSGGGGRDALPFGTCLHSSPPACLPGLSCGRSCLMGLQFRNHFIPDTHKPHCDDGLVFVVPAD